MREDYSFVHGRSCLSNRLETLVEAWTEIIQRRLWIRCAILRLYWKAFDTFLIIGCLRNLITWKLQARFYYVYKISYCVEK